MLLGQSAERRKNNNSARAILVSVKLFVRNSGSGNGCANFMGAWKNAFFLQKKTHVHEIPSFRGVNADLIFMGAGIFLKSSKPGLCPYLAGLQRVECLQPHSSELVSV